MGSSSKGSHVSDLSNLVSVDTYVYLGSMTLFNKHSLIKSHNISRIITLTTDKPDRLTEKAPGVYYKHISMEESRTNNMVLFFEQCYRYICESQDYDENIVIMSKENESMSVTIVTAFLMKKYRISADQALSKLKQKWTGKWPDSNFLQHLNLWQNMGFRLKSNEPQLRHVLIDWLRSQLSPILVHKNEDIRQLKKNIQKISDEYTDVKLHIERTDPTFEKGQTYHCRHCNEKIFSARNIIKNPTHFECQFVFVEPISWILDMTLCYANTRKDLISGPINCHNCKVNIGRFDWNPNTGCQCQLHRGLERYSIYGFS